MKGVALQNYICHKIIVILTDNCVAQGWKVVFERYKFAQLLNVFNIVVPPVKLATLKKQP